MEIIIGPMFSGKTTELIRRSSRYQRMGKRCLYLKYKGDTRYSENITSHDHLEVSCILVSSVEEILHLYPDYDVISVDEAQFIKNLELLDSFKGKVIIAGLDADFRREPFRIITDLIAKAQNVTKLSGICKCGEESYFTKLNQLDNVIGNELIGGEELYSGVCRTCFDKK